MNVTGKIAVKEIEKGTDAMMIGTVDIAGLDHEIEDQNPEKETGKHEMLSDDPVQENAIEDQEKGIEGQNPRKKIGVLNPEIEKEDLDQGRGM
jgi:hypothetical protein